MTTSDLIHFFSAANSGNISIMKKCIDDGIDIHSCNDLALRLAVRANEQRAIIFLLVNGANIQAVYDDALCHFSLEGDVELVKTLLEHNLCSYESKNFAMFNAILGKNQEIIKLLLQNGVSPIASNKAFLNIVELCKDDNIATLFKEYQK